MLRRCGNSAELLGSDLAANAYIRALMDDDESDAYAASWGTERIPISRQMAFEGGNRHSEETKVSDNIIGTVKSPSGSEFHVSWNGHGYVYVKKIAGWIATWDRPSQKASSATEAMPIAEAFVYDK